MLLGTDCTRNLMKGFPCGSVDKESACNVGDLGSIPGLGRSPGEGKGYPLQYSGQENSVDCMVHGIAKSRTWLNDSLHFIQLCESWISLRAMKLIQWLVISMTRLSKWRKNEIMTDPQLNIRNDLIYSWSSLRFKSSSTYYPGFLCSSVGKESACNAGDLGLIPG